MSFVNIFVSCKVFFYFECRCNSSLLQVLPLPVATGKEIIHSYLAKKNKTVTEQQKQLILNALKVGLTFIALTLDLQFGHF